MSDTLADAYLSWAETFTGLSLRAGDTSGAANQPGGAATPVPADPNPNETPVKQMRFTPVDPSIAAPSGPKVRIGQNGPMSGAKIAPGTTVIKDFTGAGGKKITVAKTAGGGVSYTALPPPVREITFSGGGAKGAALPGAVKALEESGVLKDATKIAGASVGSMTAALVAAGVTSKEFTEIANDPLTTKAIVEGTGGSKLGLLMAAIGNTGSPLTGKGLETIVRDVLDNTLRKRIMEYQDKCSQDGKAPDETVVAIAKRLGGNKAGPKFIEMRDLSKVIPAIKEVVITGTYTTEFSDDGKGKQKKLKGGNDQGQLYVFDADSEPDLEVSVAVHASASFPFAFKPVNIKLSSGLTVRFIDGGVMNNTPTSSTIGNDADLDPMPDKRGLTFVFEDESGASANLAKGKAAPEQSLTARFIDWAIGAKNHAAEYEKNRSLADKPEEIVVVPLTVTLPPAKKGGKGKSIDMRDGTLNFSLPDDAKIALQQKTEGVTNAQIAREQKPKTKEFASENDMFVSIPMADLKTLKDNKMEGAEAAFAFRETVAAAIGVLSQLAKGGGKADAKKEAKIQQIFDDLNKQAGGDADFQGYVGREVNKAHLDNMLAAMRRQPGEKNDVVKSALMVADAVKVHAHAVNVLKYLIYPQMAMEGPKRHIPNETLSAMEQILRKAKTADEFNKALNQGIKYFKDAPDTRLLSHGHKEFAHALQDWIMPAPT